MSDNRSKRDWVWLPFVALFLIVEGIAIFTKERLWPTFSRTVWRLSNWQVKLPGPRYTTIKPLRIALFFFMVWLTIHLVGGPCALGVC